MRPTIGAVSRSAALRRILVTAGAALLIATVALAAPAQADPKPPAPSPAQPAGAVPGGFSSWAELFSYQDKLNGVANRILAAGGAPYASIVAAPDSRQLKVFWKGQVPASMRELAAHAGVPVTFLPARFTQHELVAEARRLAADARIATAAPRPDGSGVAVTVTTTNPTAQREVQRKARLPVTITAGQRPEPLYSRQGDIPPFWGGSRYNSPVGACTNGFAITIPGGPNWYEISAGHCGDNRDGAWIPGRCFIFCLPTGSITGDNNPRDILLIAYSEGVAGSIYNGPWTSSNGVGVGGAVVDFVGNFVCTGGASSGEHCGIQVQAVNQFINIGYVIGPETFAKNAPGWCASAPGDSGGPVYSYRSDGRVNARGTISAGLANTATCPGAVATGSSVVWYAPLLRPAGDPQIGSLQFYGFGIMTG